MAGLKLSVRKCKLFQKQAKYLGHLVTADGIPTDEDKIRAVKDWPLHALHSWDYVHITDALLAELQACMSSPRI